MFVTVTLYKTSIWVSPASNFQRFKLSWHTCSKFPTNDYISKRAGEPSSLFFYFSFFKVQSPSSPMPVTAQLSTKPMWCLLPHSSKTPKREKPHKKTSIPDPNPKWVFFLFTSDPPTICCALGSERNKEKKGKTQPFLSNCSFLSSLCFSLLCIFPWRKLRLLWLGWEGSLLMKEDIYYTMFWAASLRLLPSMSLRFDPLAAALMELFGKLMLLG